MKDPKSINACVQGQPDIYDPRKARGCLGHDDGANQAPFQERRSLQRALNRRLYSYLGKATPYQDVAVVTSIPLYHTFEVPTVVLVLARK
jgi:hypothetical protein